MDGSRFDDLARTLAGVQNRRRFVASLIGGLAAAVGVGHAAGAACKPADQTCREHANCCSGLCEKDANGRRRCTCPTGTANCGGTCVNPKTAFLTDPNNCGGCDVRCPRTRCGLAVCAKGQCGFAPDPKMVGRSCDDGNACTKDDVCQADGTCAGTPVTCTASDSCHTAGTCDPKTGKCSNPAKANGSSCSDNNACTQTDTCQEGVCTPGTSVICDPPGACQNAGVCNTGTGKCEYTNKSNGTICDDGNKCTSSSTCQDGVCTGVTSFDPCSADPFGCLTGGHCDPATGACVGQQQKTDGTSCAGGTLDPCSAGSTCQSGTCVSQPKDCSAFADACHDGFCDQSGECRARPKLSGTECTLVDDCGSHPGTCDEGTCVRATPPTCSNDGCIAGFMCTTGTNCFTGEPTFNECTPAGYKPAGTPCGSFHVCVDAVILGGGLCSDIPAGEVKHITLCSTLDCVDGFFSCGGYCVLEGTLCCDGVVCDVDELCCPDIDNRECKRPAPIVGGCPLF